jgi:hypothetical protein
MTSSAFTPAERLESIKAGALGAVMLLISTAIALGFHGALQSLYSVDLSELWNLPTLAVRSAIALMSGGLFGITYRYAVRADDNAQLRSGVAGAFGLVRALAYADAGWPSGIAVELLVLQGAEAIVEFAIAAQVLHYAMGQGWVKPFQSV